MLASLFAETDNSFGSFGSVGERAVGVLAAGESLMKRAINGETLRVIVEVREPSVQTVLSEQARKYGAAIIYQYERFPLVAMEVEAAALQMLLESPWVVSLVEDIADPPILNNSLPVINADQVRNLGWGGSGIAVAILDTGIDRNNPFFAGRVVEEACYSSTGTNRRSLCPNGSTAQTGAGSASINVAACLNGTSNMCTHGPHVAGIAAGDGTGVAGAPAAGVAPRAGIIAIQVFTRIEDNDTCNGNSPCVLSYTSDQIRGLERVLELSGDYTIAAANMSLGGGNYSSYCDSDSRKPVIDSLRAADIATVIAAGNDAYQSAVSAPACISTAIAVGSTNNTDGISSFSNRGPLLDLFAPGQSIVSAVANDSFGTKSGTSMAAPHVAGAWAVLRQANPNLSVSEVLALLQDTGIPIVYASGETEVTTPRIDLLAAVQTGLGRVDHFDWEPIPNQTAGSEFPVTITARNGNGSVLADFTGSANLSGYTVTAGGETTVGAGTTSWTFPLHTSYHDSRTQVIYLQSEIGGAALLSGLALDVSKLGQSLNAWTIRMKHTPLSSYATASLDAGGWTTVYRANETLSSTGWTNFVFSAPFEYNGSDNLMIDFSHNNSSKKTNGEIRSTVAGSTRSVWARSHSTDGDPLAWSGTASPTVSGSSYVPNVRLTTSPLAAISISPLVTGSFVGGMWTGSVTVNEPAGGMFLRAEAGDGQRGDSNGFDVAPAALAAPVLDPLPGATPGTSNTIRWESVAGADEYYVEAGMDADFVSPFSTSGWIAATQHTFTDLADGETYYFRAKARRAVSIESAWSKTVHSLQDATPPAAGTVTAPNVDPASPNVTTYQFTIQFTDNVAIDVATLDGADVTVAGPCSFNQDAAFVSVDASGDGTRWTATYQVTPPGAVWEAEDNGTYAIALNDNQVFDTAGNAAPPHASLAAFTVDMGPLPPLVDLQLAALGAPSDSDAAVALPASITEIAAGSDFFLEIWSQDLRSNGGIMGGYVTLTDTAAAAEARALSHGGVFTDQTSGTINNAQWRVENFGGETVSAEQGVAPNWARLGYVRYEAVAGGEIVFATVPGDTQFSLLGMGSVANDRINFGTYSLAVVPEVAIADVLRFEGNAETTAFEFLLMLSHAANQIANLEYATQDGTATLADNDYQEATGTVTFQPGETQQTITVLINGDPIVEADETLSLALFNLTVGGRAATFAGSASTLAATGTILNDDAVAIVGAPAASPEGTSIALTTSGVAPEDETLAYAWNVTKDGAPYAAGSASTFNFTPDDGPGLYRVTLSVTVDGMEIGDAEPQTISVTNVAPVVTLGDGAAIEAGGTFTGIGWFTDPGADTWSATVDYGAGSGSQALALNADKTFELNHLYAAVGVYLVAVTVADDDAGLHSDTLTVTVTASDPAHPWQNPAHAFDVTDDGWITPDDVLVLINAINWGDIRRLPAPPETPPPYFDVSGDGWLTPLDVLMVIDYINTYGAGPIPGEPLAAAFPERFLDSPMAEGEAMDNESSGDRWNVWPNISRREAPRLAAGRLLAAADRVFAGIGGSPRVGTRRLPHRWEPLEDWLSPLLGQASDRLAGDCLFDNPPI